MTPAPKNPKVPGPPCPSCRSGNTIRTFEHVSTGEQNYFCADCEHSWATPKPPAKKPRGR